MSANCVSFCTQAPYRAFARGPHFGLPHPLGYNPQMKIPVAAIDCGMVLK